MGFRMPQQPSPQHVQSGLAYTTVGHDLKSCRSIYYSHPRTFSKLDWHYYGGILDASTTPLSKGSKITNTSSCRPALGMLRSSNLAVVYTNRIREPSPKWIGITTVGYWMLQQLRFQKVQRSPKSHHVGPASECSAPQILP